MFEEATANTLVQCPYCFEHVDLFIDPDTEGSMVEDCSVCCQPWQLHVTRTGGQLQVSVERAQ